MSTQPNLSLANIFSYKGLHCRKYTPADNARVVEIVNHAFSYQDTFKGEPRTNAIQVEKYVTKNELFVFTKGAQIIGCVYTRRTGTILHFGLLVLTDEYRGSDVGKTIVNAITELAKSTYCTAVELDYLSIAPWLKSYYEKFGFVETGEREEWLGVHMIQMRKSL